MSSKSFSLLICFLFLAMMSCQSDPPLPSEPEAVVQQWQEWINKNEFDQAKKLSTANTREWIKWINEVLDEENNNTITHSEFVDINCQMKAEEGYCACVLKEEEEQYVDTFYLVREKRQWLVDIPETELEDSGTLDSLFQILQ